MDLLKVLIALISSLILALSGHSAPSKPLPTNSNPAANITSAPKQLNAPTYSQIQILGSEPTESGCPQEGHIKSPSSFDKASVTFDNQTAGDLKVYWIDFQGNRKFYSNLKAHSKYDQGTWIGHVWVVADAGDKCVKLESANAVQQVLVIN
jgi:hypothetical protein